MKNVLPVDIQNRFSPGTKIRLSPSRVCRVLILCLLGATPSLAKPNRAGQEWKEMAADAMQAHRFSRAASYLERALEMDPDDGPSWFTLGICRMKQPSYRKALVAFEKAFEMDVRPSEASFQMATAHALLGQREDALEWLLKAAALGFDRLSEATFSGAFRKFQDSQEYQSILAMIAKNQAPCADSSRHEQIEFWVGDWDVFIPGGRKAGENHIERSVDGCVLLEDWKSAQGGSGRSMTFYDPALDSWRQIWVDQAGSVIDVQGRFKQDALVLEGRHTSIGGHTEDCRLTLRPLADGKVHQKIERAESTGSWHVWFEGIYIRKKAATESKGGTTVPSPTPP